jgi:hypothetical protein
VEVLNILVRADGRNNDCENLVRSIRDRSDRPEISPRQSSRTAAPISTAEPLPHCYAGDSGTPRFCYPRERTGPTSRDQSDEVYTSVVYRSRKEEEPQINSRGEILKE